MTKRYWEMGPFHGLFTTKYDREGYLEWNGTGSSFTVATAKKDTVGRGNTIQAVHGSEVAFWAEADEIVGSLGEAIPEEHGTISVLESTANGVGGYFYEEWMKAVDPSGEKSPYVPMFFPWFEHDEYAIGDSSLKYSELDPDERDMLDAYSKITIPKLAWRRRKALTYQNPEMLTQEYPNSMEEAFLSTGSNVFDLKKLAQCYVSSDREQGYLYNNDGKLEFKESDEGHFFVWKRPDPKAKRRYVVAVDPTWTVQGDPACVQVMDRASMEQVAVWHGSAAPTFIGEIALGIAMWYGPATILNTEVQGGGRAVLDVWREANYPFIWQDHRPDRPKRVMQALGWNSTYETKNWMLGTVQGVIRRRQLIVHHPATYYEMTHFVSKDDGTFGPSRRSGHDDCVISLGVAIMTVVTMQASMDWSAMAAPEPAYVPGETPPQMKNYGKRVYVPGGPLGPVGDDDMLIGVDAYY